MTQSRHDKMMARFADNKKALEAVLEQQPEPDRKPLQAAGTHPAPCARYCEAKAFEIEIRSLNSRLKQAEPVALWQKRHLLRTEGAWENTNEHDAKWWSEKAQGWEIRALYTTPPQRQWQGLTDDEIYDMYNEPRSDAEMIAFARAIEAKLKRKNT